MLKRVLTVTLSLLLCGASFAQIGKKGKSQPTAPVNEEWNDVEIFEQNKIYPRANVIPYGNENDIEKNRYAESPYYVSLNGEWRMDLQTSYSRRPADVEQKTFSADGWRSVTVPEAQWRDGKKAVEAPKLKSSIDQLGVVGDDGAGLYGRLSQLNFGFIDLQIDSFSLVRLEAGVCRWIG